ncbi:histone family protein nucleoid-structuring protein H-NS [Caballeronia fortuita]|uniref:Histone family protein nucleoid-structuring protein H-NS n=1 Tax=Caballeronia fortuita TaxID=1777138 RepID=A0A158A830_9BURK|nr:H-NS family nucleoid-associated regulatory protein [Caballeronia fortuita]SAK53845.1 histone family protein nucleoid-structuring protein H-NS [Caballeronia fortuita]
MATLIEIQAKIQKLQAQASEIAKKQSSKVLAEIRSLMDKHGVTIAHIESYLGKSGRGQKAPSSKLSANPAGAEKYRDPKTGATWTGHGRAPAWIANAKNRNRFLIDADTTAPPVAALKQPKAGNYARGPQAPKYRDPESGATWSGRGKAPAWLATAKDRTTYLIDKVTDEPEMSDAAPGQKTAAKKGTAKKAVAKKAVAKKAVTRKVASKKVVTKKPAAKKAASGAATVKKAAVKKSTAAGKKVLARKVPTTAEVSSSATDQGSAEANTTTTA